jgi:hypothetical protein
LRDLADVVGRPADIDRRFRGFLGDRGEVCPLRAQILALRPLEIAQSRIDGAFRCRGVVEAGPIRQSFECADQARFVGRTGVRQIG